MRPDELAESYSKDTSVAGARIAFCARFPAVQGVVSGAPVGCASWTGRFANREHTLSSGVTWAETWFTAL